MSIDASPRPSSLLEHADSVVVDAIRPSPNHGERRIGPFPDCLILHYTGMADGPSAIDWLSDPASQVSCHYVVDERGGVLQMVAEDRRAWHAGRSFWAGEIDLNSASIGIEIVNAGHAGDLPDYPDAQVAAVTRLCRDIVARRAIHPWRVLAHSDIAPGRKEDPGERFPWGRLFEAGVGLWVPPHLGEGGLAPGSEGEAVGGLQADLAGYGYGLETTGSFDAATAKVVRAFQLHFRPGRVDGIADDGTIRTLHDLLAARASLTASAPIAARSSRQEPA